MSPEETIDLLAIMAAYDQRTVGEADVIAWHAALADVVFEDARRSVIGHYRENDDRIMPSDVRSRALVYADDRAMTERTTEADGCGNPICQCTHTAPCDHGWVDAEAGVSPCPTCKPERLSRPTESRSAWLDRLRHENAAWRRRRGAA
ncbi:MAG TPA: hypothetical protein VIV12_29290 [Streptosporangiaceae bacterium]